MALSLVISCCLVVRFLILCLCILDYPFACCLFDSVCNWTIARVIGLPLLSSPLDIVRRSKIHACPRITPVPCPCHTRLLLLDPACVLTMFINKSLHFDLLTSRLVGSVTTGTRWVLYTIWLCCSWNKLLIRLAGGELPPPPPWLSLVSPKVSYSFCHRWSFGSLPLSPQACLFGDTSFPVISSTWLHRYNLNWTELDDDITEFNNEMPSTEN